MRCIRILAIVAAMIVTGLTVVSKPLVSAAPDPNLKRLFLPYWVIGDGYESIVQLHNNLIKTPLAVHPVVLTPDGQRIELADVHLEALGNVSLNIGDAVSHAGYNYIQGGSAVLEYY